ncbi:MAG: ABC transporter ATP-binding protein [Eubacterium sp.]|nr:ABC transporter ATP-binding protein [Eubacterium sp.]
MKENLRKALSIFKSPGLAAAFAWTRCVHGKVALICVLTMVRTAASLVLALVTKNLIDGAVSANTDALWRNGILLAVIILGQRVLNVVNANIQIKASSGLQRNLQGMLIQQLLYKDYPSIRGYHSGELVNRVFSDMNVVKNGATSIVPNLVGILVSFFGAAGILISMDWRFVILLIAGGLLGLVLMLLFREPMKRRHKRMRDAEGALQASSQEVLGNLRLVKASVSEERMLRRIRGGQEKLQAEQIRNGRFSIWMNNSMGLVFDLSWLFCMIWGCISIFRGNLTYGSLAAMIQLIGRVQGPIANSVSLAGQVYGVTASAERLLELTNLPVEEQGEELPDFDEIRLEHVSFQYDDGDEDVLRDINGTIKRGDFMALTGISGGGKTSLFQLLLGIHQPTEGRIVFCAGQKEIPASRGTRRLFAYVPQGNMLFSGTLRENLTMFTDQTSDEEIRSAVKAACIEELVNDIGLEAVLGERGVGLSEGQAQRVAVARALLSKAPVLLLDEATSALDERTEAQLLANIAAMQDKTCLIVTHRRAALGICQYRLHIESGTSEGPVPLKQEAI